MSDDVTIRPDLPGEQDAVRRVNQDSFGGDTEARLVDALRTTAAFVPGLSLVALADGAVVGHILFTRIEVRDDHARHDALALAPMAVLPAWQRRGVGSALVRHGLGEARRLGHRAVIVLGHPEYYPRFGFRPAHALGIVDPFGAPSEAFLALELEPGALDGVRGRAVYPAEFLQDDSIEGLVVRLVEAWNAGDAASFGEAFTADAEYVSGAGERVHGRRDIGALVARASEAVRIVSGSLEADPAARTAAFRWAAGGRRGLITCHVVRDGDRWRVASLRNREDGA